MRRLRQARWRVRLRQFHHMAPSPPPDTPTAAAYHTVLTALAIWREARGETSPAQRGVMWVIRNRSRDKRWPNTAAQVILQPKQFSSFNENDPNTAKFPMPLDPSWLRVCAVVDEPGEDPTAGANHYHSAMPLLPAWAEPSKVTCRIGDFTFYKL